MAEQEIDNPLVEKMGDARALCKRAWWVFLIGGIALLVFGILAFVNPAVALLVLSVYFAASVLVDGVVNIVGAIQNRAQDGWWVILLIGVLVTFWHASGANVAGEMFFGRGAVTFRADGGLVRH